MSGDRVVLGTKGESSMVKIRWTDACPETLNDVETAENVGAKWESDELVTYDLPGLTQLLEYDARDEYTIDND
ncbi:MAG: hypothetical protein ACR2HV_08895 [Acidimicrobiales bacterium]